MYNTLAKVNIMPHLLKYPKTWPVSKSSDVLPSVVIMDLTQVGLASSPLLLINPPHALEFFSNIASLFHHSVGPVLPNLHLNQPGKSCIFTSIFMKIPATQG